nr:putative ATP-dependent RNA helicase DHX37 [Tanacetum cinerariifolium]
LYVDNMLIACKSKAEIGSTKSLLKKELDLKEFWEAKKIRGMKIVRDRSRKILWVSQSGEVDFKIFAGYCKHGLVYETYHGNHVDVTGFVDSGYDKDPDKGRSITGYAFLVHRCVVSWKATLQHVVTLSTTEAESMALTEAVNEAIWLRGLLKELGVELNTVTVNCDNQGTIHLS